VLSIADKIDSICGCFSIGLVPTGASDPYALRRQGIGIVQIMKDKGFSFSLQELIRQSLALFGPKSTESVDDLSQKVCAFIKNRIAHLLAEENYSKDIIGAILDASIDHLPNVWKRIRALNAIKARPDFEALVAGFKRAGNIIKKSDFPALTANIDAVNPDLFEHQSEVELFSAYKEVAGKVVDAMASGSFDQALLDIASLRVAVDTFFDEVMVLAEDRQVRRNRLALLGCITALFGKFADFSKLAT
jgi:glycyl-tRNA synthetase beta chain